MPQVPYKPVPSAAPRYNPTPSVGLSVPTAAFGALSAEAKGAGARAVAGSEELEARALQGFGKELESSGEKLGQVALQFQQLNNENWAREKDVDTMIQLGKAQSEYDSLEGQNQVDALPAHMERIKAIRQEALDSAPNEMARKLLDSNIARRVGFAIVDSGHKAGTAAKSVAKTSRAARKETAGANYDPANPNTAKADMDTVLNTIEEEGADAGVDRITIDNEKRKAWEKLQLQGIKRNSITNPELAKDIFDRTQAQMSADVREQAQALVNQGMARKQSHIDADEIVRKSGFDPRKGPGQLEPMLTEAQKYIEKKGKDNPDYGFYLEQRVKGLYVSGMSGYQDTQKGFEYTLGKFILGENDANRKVSIDAVIGPSAPKEIRDAYQGLAPESQKKVLNWIARLARGTPDVWTPDGLRKDQELRGMASDPEGAQKFMNMPVDEIIAQPGMPLAAKRSLLNLQRTVGQKVNELKVAEINQAMSIVGFMLDGAGISKTNTPSTYYQFRGQMEDAIAATKTEGGKAKLSNDEIRKIGSNLLQKQPGLGGMTWGPFGTRTFETSVPSAVRDDIIKAYNDKGVEAPTEEQIQRAYAHALYRKLYMEKQKSPTAPKADKGDLEGLGQ